MEYSNAYENYASFKEKQQQLGDMINDTANIISELNMEQHKANLESLSKKVHNDTFKIQVVGTFKNGKSTFINSFLGEEVLPAYALPCTAVINEVKYGAEKRAVLHFRNPLPEKLPIGIPELAQQHIRNFEGNEIPPLDIPYDQIEDYAVIPFDKDPKEMLLESPYEKIELFWPLDILKEGVEIIDSPGLNEHTTRTKVTMDYLSKADAILFVLNAQALCSEQEMKFIENNLNGQGFLDPFFVVNRFDCIKSEKEREIMRKFAQAKLKDKSSNEIFFVSALEALEGKIEENEEKLIASGMYDFERCLADFLTQQKGKMKLAQPARELKRILNDEALFTVIPRQKAILGTSLDTVKQRYEEAKPKLDILRSKKEQLKNRLELKIEQNKPEFIRISLHNSLKVAELVPTWIEMYNPQSKIGLIPSKTKTQAVISEISDFVAEKIEEQQNEWHKSVLIPVVEEKVKLIFDSVEADVADIQNEIDDINFQVSGIEPKKTQVPIWQRVVGAAGGFILGGYGLAASGAINGIGKEFAITLGAEIGAFSLLAVLGLMNPFTLGAVIIGSFLFNFIKNESNAIKKLKKMMAEQIVEQISSKSEETAEVVAMTVGQKLSEIATLVVSSMDIEIGEADKQIKALIEEMEKGQDNINERQNVLNETEEGIKHLSSQLDSLIFQLVEG